MNPERLVANLRAGLHSLLDVPEWNVACFSFLLHFTWEMLQVPFYAHISQVEHWTGIVLCAKATVGDTLIALVAFWSAAWSTRTRGWLMVPTRRAWLTYLTVGLSMTFVFELLATGPLQRWSYAPSMPLLPLAPVGLLPVLQWMVIPPIVVLIARRQIRSGSD